MLNSASFARGLAAGYLALFLAANAAVALNAQKRWQFNDVSDDGHKIVLLTYGVPGTHNVRVLALCEAARGDKSRFSTVMVVTDIKHFANSAKVNLRFSGGGFDRELRGRVIAATTTRHGITGVELSLGHEDPLWTGLQSKQRLDVLLPDKRSFALQLGDGAPKIRAFLDACKSYRHASKQSPQSQPGSPPAHTPTPKTERAASGSDSTPSRHGRQTMALNGIRPNGPAANKPSPPLKGATRLIPTPSISPPLPKHAVARPIKTQPTSPPTPTPKIEQVTTDSVSTTSPDGDQTIALNGKPPTDTAANKPTLPQTGAPPPIQVQPIAPSLPKQVTVLPTQNRPILLPIQTPPPKAEKVTTDSASTAPRDGDQTLALNGKPQKDAPPIQVPPISPSLPKQVTVLPTQNRPILLPIQTPPPKIEQVTTEPASTAQRDGGQTIVLNGMPSTDTAANKSSLPQTGAPPPIQVRPIAPPLPKHAAVQPIQTPPTLPPAPPPTPITEQVAIGPRSTPWRHGNQTDAPTAERRNYIASVTTGGMEFAASCIRRSPSGPSLTTVLREARKGTQPRLLKALSDGLTAAPVATGDMKRVRWTFSSGYRSATAAALPQLLDGELRIASDQHNFRPGDPAIAALMASDTMTIAVGNFSSTFQLKGSRASMCALARRCGARVPGCGLRRRPPQRVRRSTMEFVVIRPRASPEVRPATQPSVRISR